MISIVCDKNDPTSLPNLDQWLMKLHSYKHIPTDNSANHILCMYPEKLCEPDIEMPNI